ncbi:MAG TPA: EamA family transporter RarD [Vicinamibacteria bacterium]|nr:EamA family transporter RarD [Vicinamibacteria bacterium]
MSDARPPGPPRPSARGLAYGIAAYGLWGFMPIYIKSVRSVGALEVLCHRVAWAFLFLVALLWAQRQFGVLRALLRDGRTMRVLAAAAGLIAVNWLGYIWAVFSGRILESSLGYYINPLVNVLLGVVVLGERLERPVKAAVAIAALGVLWLTVQAGHVPWIALLLATSFGLYGLMRKMAPVGAVAGLAVETAVLLPLGLGYLGWSSLRGTAAFLGGRPAIDGLLVLAGPVTAIPLLFFSGAARRLPLSTLGFLQYLSPTLQLLLAAFVYGEPFDRSRAVTFGFIWTALVVFAIHSARRGRPEPVTDVS